MTMKIARLAVPDFVTNSYFPAIAAVELGLFAKEGVDARYELIFPNNRAYEVLRDGGVDFVAGPAHALLPAFPEWRGAKLLMALAQGTFWLLVMRADFGGAPGDVHALRGQRIGAAPFVDLTLKQLLVDAGVDMAGEDVQIVPVPGAHDPGVSFGVHAAKALAEGLIDGFWANGMGAENAVRSGVGKVILDVRRGLGPAAAFHYTIPVLATSDAAITRDPELIASGMRAVMAAQRALKAEPGLAAQIGAKVFPKAEAALIADVVARDLPFYTPDITDASVAGMVRFTQAVGMLKGAPTRDDMVASAFSPLWRAASS